MRIFALLAVLWTPVALAANPPTPSGSHPRLFLPTRLAALTQNATKSGTEAAELVDACDSIKDSDAKMRGTADSDTWPAAALACAFSYVTTQNTTHLQRAIKYWRASLDDDQEVGDKMGCVAGVDATAWKDWDGSTPAPAVIRTVAHDTGYPIRWYGPYIALTYDWLHDAPGVDDGLRSQTQTCLTNWIDFYTQQGYHNDQVGANYNAGFVIGKTLGAIALGTDIGANGDRLWTETLNDIFGKLFADGLKNANAPDQPAGVLVGGDWAEGWQYGPLSVLEYAAATLAVEEHGAPQPAMDEWASSVAVRYIYATVPGLDGHYVGGGDYDDESIYVPPALNIMDATILGPSSDQAAAWALFYKQLQKPDKQGRIWNALAEARDVTAADYRAQNPAPPLWYLARGTRAMYTRTAWDQNAFWAVFQSEPAIVDDHIHYAASNFVFSRGSDHLVVDSSEYYEPDTLATNAVTAETDVLPGDYALSQSSWSQAELVWARGTNSATFAARSDFAKAFNFADTKSDIHYAHREWVMFPEGEIVTVDRVHTQDASHRMYVNFHANTGGTLTESNCVASGTVGSSKVAIHQVLISEGGTASIFQPKIGDCPGGYPFGTCTNGRFKTDDYSLKVPGPFAVAIHVIDGLGASESATVGSLGDDNIDPAPKQNDGVIGAAVYRDNKQSYVVASSAVDGASPATMTYGVPSGASRHVVFDAPEDSSGKSMVTATKSSGRCLVSITAGAGFSGRPLMFNLDDNCTATEDTNVASATAPPGGGVPVQPGSGSSGSGAGGGGQSGCGCVVGGAPSAAPLGGWLGLVTFGLLWALRLRRRPESNRDRVAQTK